MKSKLMSAVIGIMAIVAAGCASHGVAVGPMADGQHIGFAASIGQAASDNPGTAATIVATIGAIAGAVAEHNGAFGGKSSSSSSSSGSAPSSVGGDSVTVNTTGPVNVTVDKSSQGGASNRK